MSHQKGKLIAVIGDEDTCVGFLLGGVGELNRARNPNYLVVSKSTAVSGITSSVNRGCEIDNSQ